MSMVDADKGLAAERVTAIGFEIVSDSRYICRGVEGQELTIRRMAACWNACLGIPTDTLEAGVVVVPREIVEMLVPVVESLYDRGDDDFGNPEIMRTLEAFAKALGIAWDGLEDLSVLLSRLQQNGGEGR